MADGEIKDESLKKAAIFLLYLESFAPEVTNQIFMEVGSTQAKRLLDAISKLGKVEAEGIKSVVNEFYTLLVEQKSMVGGKNISNKILGETFGTITHDSEEEMTNEDDFSFLKMVDDKKISKFIKNENPLVSALLISNMDQDRSATIVSTMKPEDAQQILSLSLNLKVPNAALISKFAKDLEDELSDRKVQVQEDGQVVKISRVLEMLNIEKRDNILTLLEKEDKNIVEKIKANMVSFTDLVGIEDKDMEKILYEITDLGVLAQALKDVDSALLEKVQKNLSKRVKTMLEEEQKSLPDDLTAEVVEASRNQILTMARHLESKNEIKKLVASKEE